MIIIFLLFIVLGLRLGYRFRWERVYHLVSVWYIGVCGEKLIFSLSSDQFSWLPRHVGWRNHHSVGSAETAGSQSRSRSSYSWWRRTWTLGPGENHSVGLHWSRPVRPFLRPASRRSRCSAWPPALRRRRRRRGGASRPPRQRWGCPGGRHSCQDQSHWRTPREGTSSLTGCSVSWSWGCWGLRTQIRNHCLILRLNLDLSLTSGNCWSWCLDCWSWPRRTQAGSRTYHRILLLLHHLHSADIVGCDCSAGAAASVWRAAWCSWRTRWATSCLVSCCWSWAWCFRTWFEQKWRPCRPRGGGAAGRPGQGPGRGSWGWRGRGGEGREARPAAPTVETRSHTRARQRSQLLLHCLHCLHRLQHLQHLHLLAVKDWDRWGERRESPGPGSLLSQCWRPQGWRCSPSRCRESWRIPSRPSCSSPRPGRSRRPGRPGGSLWCRRWGCRSPWRPCWGRGRRGPWSWDTCRPSLWMVCLDTSDPGTCHAGHCPIPHRTSSPAWVDRSLISFPILTFLWAVSGRTANQSTNQGDSTHLRGNLL